MQAAKPERCLREVIRHPLIRNWLVEVREVERIVLVVDVAALGVRQRREGIVGHEVGPDVVGGSRRDGERIAAGGVGEERDRAGPDVMDVAVAIRIRKVRIRMRTHSHRLLPLVEIGGGHHSVELLTDAKLAVISRTDHVDPAIAAVDHRSDRCRQILSNGRCECIPVLELDRQHFALNGHGLTIKDVVIGPLGIDLERVDLV